MREWIFGVAIAVVLTTFHGAAPGDDNSSPANTGLDNRVPWTTSTIVGSPEPSSPYRVEKAFPWLNFQQPTVLTMAPGDTRWYVAELDGRVYSFRNDPDLPQEKVDLFFDLPQHIERVSHIYGMTFHPDFQRNGYVYICYLQGEGFAGDDRVCRFKVTGDNPPRVDPSSEQLLLKWPTGGHNGCCLKFGPDGFLYISSGDGASPSPPDPYNTGQDISDIKSSILRIDVDRTSDGLPYAIPPDNPFVAHPNARPEVWAYGFRNPWKMSFDFATGDLWVGDIGWDMWEMVFRVKSGGNYGWSLVEGGQTIRTDIERGPTPVEPPVLVHGRSEFRSITGGFVYHGRSCPDLTGTYIYGDYVTGELWGLRYDGEQVTSKQRLTNTQFPIIAFAEDHDGELYVVDYGRRRPGNAEEGGSIYRLVPNESREANQDFPRLLSETGLFTSVGDQRLAPGVVAYSINAEPWEDGATSTRAVAIPDRGAISVYEQEDLLRGHRAGSLRFPENSVLLKTLSLKRTDNTIRPVETQVLHQDGDVWRPYSYVWNEAATDAELAPAGGTERVLQVADLTAGGGSRQQTWRVLGRSECAVCHNPRVSPVLGFNAAQLDRAHRYAGVEASQPATLAHIGLFDSPKMDAPNGLVSPVDHSASLESRARSWLDVNCAHCHGQGGAGGAAQLRLQHPLTLEQTGLVNGAPNQGQFGIPDARLVVPGDPFRSVLYYRIAKLGKGRMPHIGSGVLDRSGLQLIHDWIASLPASGDSPAAANGQNSSRPDRQALVTGLEDRDKQLDNKRLSALLESPDGALQVQYGLLTDQYLPETRGDIPAMAARSTNPHVAELFLDFLPEEQRPQEIELNPTHVLGLAGDADRGRQLFLTDARLQCRNCHQAEGKGTSIGPDLSQIGRKYRPGEMLHSLLHPSDRMEPEYRPWSVVTVSGQVYTGFLVERAAGERVVLKDAQGKIINVLTEDVDEMIAQDTSLMPADALRSVPPEHIADLLAWLSSLK